MAVPMMLILKCAATLAKPPLHPVRLALVSIIRLLLFWMNVLTRLTLRVEHRGDLAFAACL